MTDQHLIGILCSKFGKHNVFVRTPYHIQVQWQSVKHDIWITDTGSIKYKLFGQRKSRGTDGSHKNINRLISVIESYKSENTDLGMMQDAYKLSALIGEFQSLALNNQIRDAVFVDAGWKNGESKIAAVRISDTCVSATIKKRTDNNIFVAEEAAIHLGLSMSDHDPDIIIYSDCYDAVLRVGLSNVKWMSRTKNQVADKMANLRTSSQ